SDDHGNLQDPMRMDQMPTLGSCEKLGSKDDVWSPGTDFLSFLDTDLEMKVLTSNSAGRDFDADLSPHKHATGDESSATSIHCQRRFWAGDKSEPFHSKPWGWLLKTLGVLLLVGGFLWFKPFLLFIAYLSLFPMLNLIYLFMLIFKFDQTALFF